MYTTFSNGWIRRRKVQLTFLVVCVSPLLSSLWPAMYWEIRKTCVDVRSLEGRTGRQWERAKRREENVWKAKGEWQKAAISSSLVLREHIYFTLISNALVSFLSLCIVETCDLILTACSRRGKKGGIPKWAFYRIHIAAATDWCPQSDINRRVYIIIV